MRELLGALTQRPWTAFELVTATALIAVLTLASPLYVIQLLNRYVAHGFDGTLITLTAGVFVAILLLLGFRTARMRMAAALMVGPERRLGREFAQGLAQSRVGALERLDRPDRPDGDAPSPPLATAMEAAARYPAAAAPYDGRTLCALLDGPFSALYLLAVFLLSPTLGAVAVGGLLFVMVIHAVSAASVRTLETEHADAARAVRVDASVAAQRWETVRAFRGGPTFLERLNADTLRLARSRSRLARALGFGQSFGQTGMLATTTAVYAVGAVLAVEGNLSVGALIGASILSSRAFQAIVGCAQAFSTLRHAAPEREAVARVAALEKEPESGVAIRNYAGAVRFEDMAFAWPNAVAPLFESLTLRAAPGELTLLTGPSGAGKSVLIKLVAGLLTPTRGELLADNTSLRQLAPAWWRAQLIYMPQEPVFLPGTIRDNLLMANPAGGEQAMAAAVRAAGLERLLLATPDGLETTLPEGGARLAPGVRRRLALARGLMTGGRLALLDDPVEALDAEGARAVHSVIEQLLASGRCVIAAGEDPQLLRRADVVVDLGVKPRPTIRRVTKAAPVAQTPSAPAPQES